MSALSDYLHQISRELTAGRATEHSHRPALKALMESLADAGITATNEPRRVACGAPDYVVTRPAPHGPLTIGYVETKDVGASLDEAERSTQLRRYLAALPNLILTNYLDFRWYVDGTLRQSARLARLGPGNTLLRERGGAEAVEQLLRHFLEHRAEPITSAQELALRMARLTHIIRDIIIAAFEQGQASDLLKGWRDAFAKVLIADLDQPEKTAEFADMFAQTLAYGLFSARVMDTTPGFTRQEAQRLIPKTNPFLRKFFYEISGIHLDDEPYVGFVDDLAALLDHTDMEAVLADFGKRTRREDPVVHFYETFLAAYDPQLREKRGVYYTPEPVVSYIVRSVDHLLRTRFGCTEGLADATMITIPNPDPALKGKKTAQTHRVLILDPACGTGTFLYAVVDHIRQRFMEQGSAGMWSGYVRQHLLPRLFGFELLMAPYAVAHFKLGLQLAGRDLPEAQRAVWAYDFAGDERVGIYLTNSLEGVHEWTGYPLFTQWLADETNAANQVKRDLPIMVVMGNPPYSASSQNKGEWITKQIQGNYYPRDEIKEANPKLLLDDYVKFIRFAQWRIEQTGYGILAFISNHGYLDNPTFRAMRQSLMQTFDEIYVLNLHGNAKKKERSPDGSKDENIFDIQQGVAIGILVKHRNGKEKPATVYHADLWGVREVYEKDTQGKPVLVGGKYYWLWQNELSTTAWETFDPQPPFYLFVPQHTDLYTEYERGWKLTGIMPVNSTGIKTHRDHFVFDFDLRALHKRIEDFRNLAIADEEIAQKYRLQDTRDWKLSQRRRSLAGNAHWERYFTQCLYRPFDLRAYYHHADVVELPRPEVMRHMVAGKNISLLSCRQQAKLGFHHVFCSTTISECCAVSLKTREITSVFPLYLYPTDTKADLFDENEPTAAPGGRRPNLNPAFIADFAARLGMTFTPDGKGDRVNTFGPEDVFHYIYAVLHSPTYRSRYAEFLKIDFPRVPLTANPDLFRALCDLGAELVALHLLEKHIPLITRYPVPSDNTVENVRYTEPGQGAEQGRVWINKTQYFEGVPPEVWQFQVGGYQVCYKWLKDRKGRQLTFDDLYHYQRIVAALAETIRLMDEIDEVIPGWPVE